MNSSGTVDHTRGAESFAGLGNLCGKKGDRLLAGLLFFCVALVFLTAVRNDFVGFDDPLYVTGNAHVQQGLTWHTLAWAFSSGEAANWHPVTWISHLIDFQLFGLQAWGHHLTSILLHALSTMLLFSLLNRITGARWRSFFVAALFGLHPLRVESVAWVSERKDVLSTMFWMLTLWAYSLYVERKRGKLASKSGTSAAETATGTQCTGARYYYALTLVFFALGLMTKPMLVTLPFVLLLLDYWPLGRFTGKESMARELRPLFLEKLPLFAMAVGISIITFVVQKGGGAVMSTTPLAARLANGLISYCRYLGKIFLPRHLAPFYPPVESWPLAAVIAAGALLVGISILTIFQRQSRPWLLVGWFWFLGTLVPVIGLVQAGEQSMADRYSYLPSIGVMLAVAWGAFDFCNWLARKRGAQLALNFPRLLFAISGIIMIFCAGLTVRQISYWRDTRTLFQHALEVTENNYLAHNNVGTALDKAGLVAEAVLEFQKALRARPNYAEAHNNLGVALGKLGHLDQAMTEYRIAFKLKPNYGDPHKNLGIILEQLGRINEALHEYQTALRMQPDDADAHNNLGAALGRTGRTKEAINEFEKVLALQPNSADAHNNLGVALDASGRLDAAIDHFKQAVRLNPGYARAHFNLGGTLTRKGELEGAIFEFQEALRLKPDYAAARTNLAIALEMKKRAQHP